MTPWRKAGVTVAGTCVVLGTAGALAIAIIGDDPGFGTRVALLCWLGAGAVAALTGLLGVLLTRPNGRAATVPRHTAARWLADHDVGDTAPPAVLANVPSYTATDRTRVP